MTAAVLILMSVALCCSHLFSASETAFFSLGKVHSVSLRRSGDRRSRTVAALLSRPHRLLVTVLLGNMVANVSYASLSVVAAHQIAGGDLSLLVGIQVVALIVLVLGGDLIPKHIALSNPARISMLVSGPIAVFQRATSPVVAVASRVSAAVAGLFVREPGRPELTTDELDVIVRMGELRGVIDGSEEDFLQGILDMREVRVSEIMIPRVDVDFADVGMSREELESFARENTRSKLPVQDGSPDNVVGVIHVKDLVFSSGTGVRDIVRRVEFVPENMLVGDLLETLRKENENFAVVVDEYGGTSGVVTLEDVMEEIVGEIEDKYDRERPDVQRREAGGHVIRGTMSIRDWNERFRADIEEEDVDTIGGYIMSVLDRPPKEGDTITCGRFRLTVSVVSGRRVEEIVVSEEGAG